MSFKTTVLRCLEFVHVHFAADNKINYFALKSHINIHFTYKIDYKFYERGGGLVGRAPEGCEAAPDGRAPDGRAPDGRAPDGRAPDGRAPVGLAPDGREAVPAGR